MKERTYIHVFRKSIRNGACYFERGSVVEYIGANHPWKRMVQAAYRKYPNPYSAHIHSLDTLQRTVSGRKLYSHRIFSTLWKIPTIALQMVGSADRIHVREQSVCDLNSETLIVNTRNVSLSHLFTMTEKFEYTVCKDDPSKTILKQSAYVDVHGVPLLGSILDGIFMSNYETSISNGRLGADFVAEQLAKEESTINETTSRQ